ncbi:MAG: hypothetical protein JO051_05430 [Acidobacteriaceae bacterium]|nr:hypothetical protein [Acidobacteriaceae bacterium]
MRRALLRLLGVAVFTWLEFAVFPGHTYLRDGTQLSVPMIERLANPGFLSRDLVATHPTLQFTAYDEVTLFLNQITGVGLEKSLVIQQIVCRGAGILGVLLLTLSAGMTESLALLIAATVNLGATLAGPHLMLVDLEPVPYALAWGLIILAIGLLAREKPLLAGLAGGVALIYQPILAAPFWLLSIVMLVVDRRLRRLLRPAMTVFAVFLLLLANLAQLQPGIAEQQSVFDRIPAAYVALQQFRSPYQYVSLWSAGQFWSYLAIWIAGVWAVTRIWPVLNRQARWIFLALSTIGVLAMPVSYVLLDRLRWSAIPHIEPTQWLLFTVCLSSAACWIGSIRAAQQRRFWESAIWLGTPVLVTAHAEVLESFRLIGAAESGRFGVAILFVCASALLLTYTAKGRARVVALAIPLFAMGVLAFSSSSNVHPSSEQQVIALADWVRANTWGSSMFLFSDLDRSTDPGLFRGRSERALWVDWNSGALVTCFESFAAAWWDRWHTTMEPGYSPRRLQANLFLPIDYYVLTRAHRLYGIKPVYANEEFLVYDANDLRNASGPLHTAAP